MAYAVKTDVPVSKTRQEIEDVINKYGATTFACATSENRAQILFEVKGRRIRFDLSLPTTGGTQRKVEQLNRSRWRALLLCIRAKLEAVASEIETFEEAFLAHVVMPDGRTAGSHVVPAIAAAYKAGKMLPLLPQLEGPKS